MATPTTTFRLDDDTKAHIDRLRDAIRDPVGRPLTASDVIRVAVAELARNRLPEAAPEKKKKSG